MNTEQQTPYDRLARRLAESDSPTVTTLPDGSIDRYGTVSGDGSDALETREALARELLGNRAAIEFRVEAVEPGGQAVNAAEQLHELGGDVTCYGHLGHPVFDSLPFEAVSMGDPSTVYVFGFNDRDVMFVNNSAVVEWTLDELRRVGSLSDIFGGDAICCSNWVSVPGLESAFHRLGAADLPRIPFVFDPGDIVGSARDDIDALHDALAALQGTFDVVYSGNREEIRTTAAPLSAPAESGCDNLTAIRNATGISAAVMHARDEAAAATSDGRTSVETHHVADPERHTGGGDRFSAGVAHALACGWAWDTALACGNTCAVYYVGSGKTGSPEDLGSFIRDQ